MAVKRNGSAVMKAAISVMILLAAALYAMRWFTDKKTQELEAQAPVAQAAPAAQQAPALPEDAYKYGMPASTAGYTAHETQEAQSPDANPDVQASPYEQQEDLPDLFTNIVSKADADKCVEAYSRNPKALANILVANYIENFVGPHVPAKAKDKALLDSYIICANFAGAMQLDCRSNTLRDVCVVSAQYDLIYAALNRDKDPSKCSRFMEIAFDPGESRPSGICESMRTSVERRSAVCGRMGAQCEQELLFLSGKKACASLRGGEAARCGILADLMADKGWLAEILKTKSLSACSGLGVQLVKTFCGPAFAAARGKAALAGDQERRGGRKSARQQD